MTIKINDYRFLGMTIQHAIDEVIKEAGAANDLAEMDFNGVKVTLAGDSDAGRIYRDWSRAMEGKTAKAVGPYPAATLTAEELASDVRVEAENKARQKAREAEWRRECEEARKEHAAALAGAPAMERSEPRWAQGIAAQKGSAYGLETYQFAEDWARLMQVRIAAGENLSDIADECCTVADKAHGITGFMYGCAVGILAETWVYGDTLRRWHNAKYGRADAKGAVNPAILTISRTSDGNPTGGDAEGGSVVDDSAVTEGDVPQADLSSEIEGLVDALIEAAADKEAHDSVMAKFGADLSPKEGARLSKQLSNARTALLSRLSPTPTDQIQAAKDLGPRPCDCTRCDCGNVGDAQAVAAWDAESALQSTPSPQGGTVGRDPQQVHDTNSDGEATGRDAAHLEWAVSRWNAEVANRPVRNVHRRALDDTWRQAIRRFGGDPDALVGPSHDALIADGLSASPRPSHEGMSDASPWAPGKERA